MTGDPSTQAVLLLTVSLGKADREGAKPLSPGEWARLADWLGDRGLDPSTLLENDFRDVLSGWDDRSVTLDRLDGLLGRGAALGLAVEKWQRAGLWILARPDPGYPTRLARRLGPTAPPVLFGCGNRLLLERGGLAVVGSRDAGEDDLDFSRFLGETASQQGYSIVSGGARGVDRSAMKGAFDGEGTAVAVLADSLLRAATSALYRRPLFSGDLALVCAVNPEAQFNVGNAMARNRYIYCLADAAVVVATARGSGGTWNGACENAKAGWVPLWVKRTSDPASGNAGLIERGARPLPDPLESLATLFERSDEVSARVPASLSEETRSWGTSSSEATPIAEQDSVMGAVPEDFDFYQLFLARLTAATAEGPLSNVDVAKRLDIAKGQIEKWLKRGVAEGAVERVTRPVRYRAPHRVQPLPLEEPAVDRSVPRVRGAVPTAVPAGLEFQDLFLVRLGKLTADEPCSSTAIARSLDVARGQVNAWLRRGIADGRIHKTNKPVRYSLQPKATHGIGRTGRPTPGRDRE